MSILKTILAASALGYLSLVAGHGYIMEVTAPGQKYESAEPANGPHNFKPKPNQPVWEVGPLAEGQGWGFVHYSKLQHPDIICHINGRPGPGIVKIGAGQEMSIRWNTWPIGHPGFMMVYIANCNGPCTNVNKEDLLWSKMSEAALVPGPSPAGEPRTQRWATDDFIANGFVQKVVIPNVVPGFYVLRHELISLHQTDTKDRPDFGAQFYPHCISLEVTGSGTVKPGGVRGTQLYKADEMGFNVNVYAGVKDLKIPGPPVADFSGSGGQIVAQDYKGESSSSAAVSAVQSSTVLPSAMSSTTVAAPVSSTVAPSSSSIIAPSSSSSIVAPQSSTVAPEAEYYAAPSSSSTSSSASASVTQSPVEEESYDQPMVNNQSTTQAAVASNTTSTTPIVAPTSSATSSAAASKTSCTHRGKADKSGFQKVVKPSAQAQAQAQPKQEQPKQQQWDYSYTGYEDANWPRK